MYFIFKRRKIPLTLSNVVYCKQYQSHLYLSIKMIISFLNSLMADIRFIDFLGHRVVFTYVLFITLIYTAFLLLLSIKYYNKVSKKQISLYISIMLFFLLLTFISYTYDFSIEMEVKQDIHIARYRSIFKYAIISWFVSFMILSIYLYIINRIDLYVVIGFIIYGVLTLFLCYLLLCEWYIINPLITAEIEHRNYIAEQALKAATDAAKKASLEEEQYNDHLIAIICLVLVIVDFTANLLLIYSL